MDWIVALIVFVISMPFLLYFHFSGKPRAQRFRKYWPTITQKVMIALMLSFTAFALASPQIPNLLQKAVITAVSALLIAAMGIQFGTKGKE